MPFFVDKNDEAVRMAIDEELRPELWGPGRMVELATHALSDLCRHIDFKKFRLHELSIYVALPEERPGWGRRDNEEFGQALSRVELPFSIKSLQFFPQGHAAGTIAMESAVASMQAGREDVAIILGVDSYLNFHTLQWLDENRQLANTYNRGAFFPGEGAGALLLASSDVVRAFNLEAPVGIKNISRSIESNLIKTDKTCLGEGLTQCMIDLLSGLQLPQQSINGIICDINGERYRAEEWGFTILRCGEYFDDPTAYELPASGWGDVGAASGPLFMGMVMAAGQRGYAKGSRYIVWNSSENGQRAGVLLELNLN